MGYGGVRIRRRHDSRDDMLGIMLVDGDSRFYDDGSSEPYYSPYVIPASETLPYYEPAATVPVDVPTPYTVPELVPNVDPVPKIERIYSLATPAPTYDTPIALPGGVVTYTAADPVATAAAVAPIIGAPGAAIVIAAEAARQQRESAGRAADAARLGLEYDVESWPSWVIPAGVGLLLLLLRR